MSKTFRNKYNSKESKKRKLPKNHKFNKNFDDEEDY